MDTDRSRARARFTGPIGSPSPRERVFRIEDDRADALESLSLTAHGLQQRRLALAIGREVRELTLQRRQRSNHVGEGVVDFVPDRRGQPAEGHHSVCHHEMRLQPLALAQVSNEAHGGQRSPEDDVDGGHFDGDS